MVSREPSLDSYSIRPATLADEAGVSSLLRQTYPILMKSAYDAGILRPALELMTQARPELLDSGTYYVAESFEGLIVGCGGWTKENPGRGKGEIVKGVGHIRHFGTHPEWTGRGVARAIYSRCEVDARNAGVSRLDCYSSLNAEGFYSAMGFERIGQIEIHMGNDLVFPSVHMTREI
jgi:N-acetylglutamate synthase-like GNAT family acetyltransferase